ncbi:MAG: hypothetical protein ABR599_03670 [Gemmatimonadota bacterium]
MNEYVREYAKVERRARRRGSFVLVYVPCLVLVAAAAIFGRVWTQTQAVARIEELTALQDEERELRLVQQEHGRALVGLTTRERLAGFARERLGMEYPAERDVVFLPVAGAPEAAEPLPPRRLEPPSSGLVAFVEEHLRGLVNRDAYALSTM